MRINEKFEFLHVAVLLALGAITSGCATAGVLYEDVGHPPINVIPRAEGAGIGWDPNLNASMGGRELLQRGVACSQDILKLVAWGDATQAAAAKQGGVTQVVGVDFENTAILGFFYTKSCTVVYGNSAPSAASVPADNGQNAGASNAVPTATEPTPPAATAPSVGTPTVAPLPTPESTAVAPTP